MQVAATRRRAGVRGKVAPPSRAAPSEGLLAVMTSWAVFAAFGLCFVLSGIADSDLLLGLIGFALLLVGFGAHIVINSIFGLGFTGPQVALALTAFSVAALSFIAGAIFDPGFTETDLIIGIAGFGALTFAFLIYVLIRYGLRGSYAMLHQLHRAERRAP
jgi:hypothetical protein